MKPAPVRYAHFAEGFGTCPGVHYWNTTEEIGELPVGATVSERTLNALGYEIPRNEQPCECGGTLGDHQRGCEWPE
jgi:hypothetical protein